MYEQEKMRLPVVTTVAVRSAHYRYGDCSEGRTKLWWSSVSYEGSLGENMKGGGVALQSIPATTRGLRRDRGPELDYFFKKTRAT